MSDDPPLPPRLRSAPRPAAVMKSGQSGSSWTADRSLMFGGNGPTPSASPSSFSSSVVTSVDGVSFSEGDLLLQVLNGFVLVVTAEGYVFYTSPTIQDFLGFHQSDVVHQSVFELIHADDRALFRRQLHFSFNPNADESESPSEQNSSEVSSKVVTYDLQDIPPENSSFLERSFCCRFRCLLDNSSGFLTLNFHGRLKFLHGQNRVSEDGTLVPPQLALFCIATPLQQPSILEIRTKTLIFQTKHKLDFTPMGIDGRGKVVLGYNEVEICMKGSGYSFIHAADMMYCADKHLRMMKTGESGFTFFRLLTKDRRWVWVQSNARLVFKDHRPEFIVARQRALTNEEGEEQLRLRQLQLPFSFATGEAMLYDQLPTLDISDSCSTPKQRKIDSDSVSPNSLLGCLLSQDQSAYCKHTSPNNINTLSDVAFQDTHATVSIPQDVTPKPPAGGPLLKMDSTAQDMIACLQQIFGETDLIETVDVSPEELKSWESSLMGMDFTASEFSEDLNDILSSDILLYVEEQLQKEGGLQVAEQPDHHPVCVPNVDLQNPTPDQAGQQNFGWPLQSQKQPTPNGEQSLPVLGAMKLSHMDFPQMSSGFNGPSPQQSLPGSLQMGSSGNLAAPVTFNPSCRQSQTQQRTFNVNLTDGQLGPVPLRQTSSDQVQTNQMAPPTQRFPVQNQNTGGPLNSVFVFQGNQWDNPNRAAPFRESFPPNISTKPSFPADSSSFGCFPLQPQRPRPLVSGPPLSQIPGFQTHPADPVTFRTPDFPDQKDCMFRNSSAALLPNRVQQNPARLNHNSGQIPSKTSCFYQALPGGGTVAAFPNPKEAPLSYQVDAGLNPNCLLVPPPPQFLHFSEQNQMENHPLVANGGFPFSSLPNGNPCLTENK
ncbi:aryl hydrocarbon receptor isoform X2 [Kryptolebias marmoratus]|uniref:Aryl hydrocarbon receptor 2 n=1 Tax=Kryptolebias marmoratus TaxID=37003 RepID=A0A3Q3AAX8_KRYMA|nr:aryl hydrocarbon receptor isoform X2 [Kryptolebias marmoratus]